MRIWCIKLADNGRFVRASSNDGLICTTLQVWHQNHPEAEAQYTELVNERCLKLQQQFMRATGLSTGDLVQATVASIMETTVTVTNGEQHGSRHK